MLATLAVATSGLPTHVLLLTLLPDVLLPGNTRRAHRLMAWAAKEHGLAKQDALAEQLFQGYHCKVRGQGAMLRHIAAMLLGCWCA